jgi:RimJ/RimL family protein N-acetyltransferase
MGSCKSDTPVEPVDLELRDGRHVTVRTIREEDADKLQEAIRSLSIESSYYRFFSPLRQLPAQLLERATHPEPGRELQLIAVVGAGAQEKIIGGARYAALPQDGDCEFAVAIIDGWHGLGLARRLLEMLIDLARAGGFRRMEGYVLASNARMLSLAKRLGFTAAISEDPSVRTVRRDLDPAS